VGPCSPPCLLDRLALVGVEGGAGVSEAEELHPPGRRRRPAARIGVHGLRHTWATLALRAGVPIKVVSQRIGHADLAVTMQVYAHALDGDDATAAETTATAIFGDR
jgi:integrase